MYDTFWTQPDSFGLTEEDWGSLTDLVPPFFTGPALLWWALAGRTEEEDGAVNDNPLLNLLSSVAGDARTLATLASSSNNDDVRTIAAGLGNLSRRIDAAVTIVARLDELERNGPPASNTPFKAPALPCPNVPPRPDR